MVGHILNIALSGYVTDAGTYALVGAAALLVCHMCFLWGRTRSVF